MTEWNLSIKSIHKRMISLKPKSGTCDFCGEQTKTDYALKHGRTHQPTPDNYWELCRGCHSMYDRGEIRDIEVFFGLRA